LIFIKKKFYYDLVLNSPGLFNNIKRHGTGFAADNSVGTSKADDNSVGTSKADDQKL